jgi:hypothetical protein
MNWDHQPRLYSETLSQKRKKKKKAYSIGKHCIKESLAKTPLSFTMFNVHWLLEQKKCSNICLGGTDVVMERTLEALKMLPASLRAQAAKSFKLVNVKNF